MTALFGVYGVGGFGREVMPLARAQLRSEQINSDRLVFIDDRPEASVVNGQRVMTYDEFLREPTQERHVAIAIANSGIRERLSVRCAQDGVRSWAITSSNSSVLDDAQLGSGAIICPFVTLGSNIRVGVAFHANVYSYVAHDCIIGDYVTFAPAVKCSGNVVIEDHAYIGAGVVIKQGIAGRPLIIGKGAVVGMGAVVTRSVSSGTTVIGNPAVAMAGHQIASRWQ